MSCKVIKASTIQKPSRTCAIKILKRSADEENAKLFRNEAYILRKVAHRRIIELVDAYDDAEAKSMYLVFGFLGGGELFEKVQKEKVFTEKSASNLVLQMLEALQYCHHHNVVHRDLKPENFVLEANGTDMRLIDFGCAVVAKDEQVIDDIAGSPYYVAPEVLGREQRTGKIWKAADMWSIGVIIFLLVVGYPPFNGGNQDEIFKKIAIGTYRFPEKKGLSKDVQDLVAKLLVKNPRNRLTVDQAIHHPWILNAPDNLIPMETLSQLGKFQDATKMKKAVSRVLAGINVESDYERLAHAFKKYDTNGDGKLDAAEIANMMADMHASSSPEAFDKEAKQFIASYDSDQSGDIDLKEFEKYKHDADVGARLSDEKEATRAFRQIDRDGNGELDRDEIAKFLKVTADEASALIREVDSDGNGVLNLDEWIKAMGIRKAQLKKP